MNQFESEMLLVAQIVQGGDYESRQQEVLNKSKRILLKAARYASEEVVKEVAILDCYIRILTKCYCNVLWTTKLPKYTRDWFAYDEYLDDIKQALIRKVQRLNKENEVFEVASF